MAINDDATLVISAGNYLHAVTGTPCPVDLRAPSTPWENFGHTPLEDILSIESEGGEATVIGTLQKRGLRTKYSTRTETLRFTLQQFDRAALKFYYGSNAVELPNGMIGSPETPVPTTCAFLAVFIDGDNVFALHAPKAEIYRAEDLSFADTESLAGLPLGVKPLVAPGENYTYSITPLGEIAPPKA